MTTYEKSVCKHDDVLAYILIRPSLLPSSLSGVHRRTYVYV